MLLKDCCTFQEGYVNPDKTKPEYFKNGNINWLKATDINKSFIYDTEDKINEDGLNSCSNKTVFPINSIVLSKSGTIGNVAILKCNAYGNRATIDIIPNEKLANPMFIYYLLVAKKEELKKRAVGSIQKNLYISCLETIEISEFDRNTQDKIANILSNIDNQIERNNAMTKRLQVLGNTIYSKEINKDTKYFDLKTVANISTGKEDANFASPNGKYNFYTCSEEISKCNEFAFDGNSILIAGNGNFNVKYYNGKFNAYQRTYVIQNDTLFGNIYYSSLKSVDGFTKNANGSIIKFITLGLVQDIKIPILSDKTNILLNDIVSQKNKIILETEKLNQLKNKLLPLLINGQLEV